MAVNTKWNKEDDEALEKADRISQLVSDLVLDKKDAVSEADALLKEMESKEKAKEKTGFSRTSINRNAVKALPEAGDGDSAVNGTDQAAFMAAIEEDAKRRAASRKANRRKAEEWKEKGNAYYKAGEFEEAKRCYSEGVKLSKDWDVLYTNLAMTCNKLAQFEETLEHCEWAARVDEKNVKALLHKGKALVALRRPQEAMDTYAAVLDLEPKREKFLREYIAEAKAVAAALKEEESAASLFNGNEAAAVVNGDPESEVPRLICKLAKPNQEVPYYAGGLRVLTAAVSQRPDSCRTQFRLRSGFSLLERQDGPVGRALASPVEKLTPEYRDVLAALLALCATVCEENEENQRRVMTVCGLPDRLVECLKLAPKNDRHLLRTAALNVLFVVSQSESGRKAVNEWLDPVLVLPRLVEAVLLGEAQAASLLNNMALSPRFQASLLNSGNNQITEAVERLLAEGGGQSVSCLPSCLSCLTNLCANQTLHRRLTCRLSFLKACAAALSRHLPLHADPKHTKLIDSLLGLLITVTSAAEKTPAIRAVAPSVVASCSRVLASEHASTHRDRLFQALSSCLCVCDADTVTAWCEGDGQKILGMSRRIVCHETGEHPTASVAVRVMAAATAEHAPTRFVFGDDETVTRRLAAFVQTSSNDVLAGNAALCLGHLVMDTCAAEQLTDTDIVKALLKRCAGDERPDARANFGLLVAKLAHANPRHRERVSELHGFEIIHAATKSQRNF